MKKGWPAALMIFVALSACPGAKDKKQNEEKSRAQVPVYSLEQFAKAQTLKGLAFSSDSRRALYSSDQGGVYNVYAANTQNSAVQQLTGSTTDPAYALAFFPEDDRVLFMSDHAGRENYRLFVRETNGRIAPLTEGEDVREQFEGFSFDKRSMFTVSNSRDRRVFDLYERDLSAFRSYMAFANDVNAPYVLGPVSRDKKLLALSRVEDNRRSRMFINELESGRTYEILPSASARMEPQFFSPDGKSLYFLTDDGGDFAYLASLDLETQAVKTEWKEDWDIGAAWLSQSGRLLAVKINRDGKSEFKLRELSSGIAINLPDTGGSEISDLAISPDDSLIAFYLGSDVEPPSLYFADLSSLKPALLVRAANPEIDPKNLVPSQLIRFKARDGMEIPGYLYKPHGASAKNKVPAVVWVHGGPGAQTTYGYAPDFQVMANRGYAVFAVNNRGSSGYGKAFYHADYKRHGKEPLLDCIDAKNYLASQDWIVPDKIAIMGRSYGGYMVLAALSFHPTEFAAGIDVVGVSNWVRTLESMPPYWSAIRKKLFEEIGDPQADRENLMAISPLFHAEKIERPLLVIQGENDVRVIKSESGEIVDAIRKKGGVVEYLLVPGEGHGFTKNENEIKSWRAILAFLDLHLKGIKPPPVQQRPDLAQ